jgi:PqqD family protein of HPr-rel-A system
MSSQSKFIRNTNAISGRLNDELVMMDIKKGKYFSLNPVATRIWDLLDQPLSMEELCTLLTEEYDVDPGQCREEVREYLEEMTRLGLVIEPPAGTL